MGKRGNGEGSIYQRKSDGKWCGQITIGFDENGKQKIRTLYANDREELIKKFDMERSRLHMGYNIEPSMLTVGKWVDIWLTQYKKNSIKPATYDGYYNTIKNYIKPYFGSTRLSMLKTDSIQQVYNKMKDKELDTASIKKVHTVLNQAFNQAIRNGIVYINPVTAAAVPKQKKNKVRILSKQEQKKFTEACDKINNVYTELLSFLLETGLRIGEALALIKDNVSLEDEEITIANTAHRIRNYEGTGLKTKINIGDVKTDSGYRKVPLTSKAYNILEHRLEVTKSEFVFCANNGSILQERNVRRTIDRIKKDTKLKDMTAHTLRHTFATRMLEAGLPLKVASEILGHKSIQITADIYMHVLPNTKKDAIKKLENFIQ
ncbi:site-specific integrase [Petroclostridium sp. X23]|uniref:tyrosine-type recombinase/integrase n=1 Tax=Petroclostridium sp. X23 TaxID=3045146 RepID=UPI0024AE567B|nr:site-specific integrase [Petroclostridium sp. X23]WHH58440.1 site-specific integrase [Petroclostridium sp. X23]